MQNRELLFQMLAEKDWDRLSEIIYEHRSNLRADLIIQHAVRLFEQEFLGHVQTLEAHDQVAKLRHVTLIIESNRKSFAENFVNQVIDTKIIALHKTQSTAFAGYASQYLDRPIAEELLKKTQTEAPEQLAEARRPAVSIKAKKLEAMRSAKTSKLFKSLQEENFYLALRKAVPHYLSYPNVAVSVVIDYNSIKHQLPIDARTYFFKAIFDFVLFDPKDGYEPSHFFELDSKYHDSPEAKQNDQLKNLICNIANVKLVRIRAFDTNEMTAEAFTGLIQELLGTCTQ